MLLLLSELGKMTVVDFLAFLASSGLVITGFVWVGKQIAVIIERMDE